MTSAWKDMIQEGMKNCLAHLYPLLLKDRIFSISMRGMRPDLSEEATYWVYKKDCGTTDFLAYCRDFEILRILSSFFMPASRQQNELSVHLKL